MITNIRYNYLVARGYKTIKTTRLMTATLELPYTEVNMVNSQGQVKVTRIRGWWNTEQLKGVPHDTRDED